MKKLKTTLVIFVYLTLSLSAQGFKSKIAGEQTFNFADKMGYKFVLRQVIVPVKVNSGRKLRFSAWLENIGVAPMYYPYRFALLLRQGRKTHIYETKLDLRKGFPGDHWLEETIPVPKSFKSGNIEVYAGIIRKGEKIPSVTLAIKPKTEKNWYYLDKVELSGC